MSATLPPATSVRRLDAPSVAPAPHFDRVVKILGVPIHDVTKDQARDWVLHHIAAPRVVRFRRRLFRKRAHAKSLRR